MPALARLAPLLLALTATPALAQTPPATPPAAPAETPAAPAVGQPFVAAEHRDWQIICSPVPVAEGQPAQPDVCEMYQLLREESGQPIAEMSIAALALTGEIIAGATITTPLETFLPAGMGFRIGAEAEEMRVEAFRVCTAIGCVVRMGLNAEEIRQMELGSEAYVTIVPFVAVDRPVNILVSLRGFTAAMADLRARTPNAPEAPVAPDAIPAEAVDPSTPPATPPAARN